MPSIVIGFICSILAIVFAILSIIIEGNVVTSVILIIINIPCLLWWCYRIYTIKKNSKTNL